MTLQHILKTQDRLGNVVVLSMPVDAHSVTIGEANCEILPRLDPHATTTRVFALLVGSSRASLPAQVARNSEKILAHLSKLPAEVPIRVYYPAYNPDEFTVDKSQPALTYETTVGDMTARLEGRPFSVTPHGAAALLKGRGTRTRMSPTPRVHSVEDWVKAVTGGAAKIRSAK